ncbi:MAG: response regulator [Syntrophobacteraceae bacterium]|jgi:putative nucleotidyltransferase with HDIG domain
MMKRILFVDDESMVLDGLRRMLRGMRNEWGMEFAASGHEALKILACGQFDVIVTDMRMPGMDGCQLLNHVKQLYPQVIRIVLSGQSDMDMVLKSVGPAHQFLSKPCDAEILKATVVRVCSIQNLLEDEALIKVVSGIESLPSLPELYSQVVDELNSADGSLNKIGEIISRDSGMSAKILQLVNSAFFGLPRQVTSAVKAVQFLGFDTVKALVLTVKVFSMFSRSDSAEYSVDDLWRHSFGTGICARAIANGEKWGQESMDEAFMAGLLHDIGKLILVEKFPSECLEVIKKIHHNARLCDAEREVFGTSHAQIGAYLLGIWGLSEPIIKTVAYHHSPGLCPDPAPEVLAAVYLANIFERNGLCGADMGSAPELDSEYLKRQGIADRVILWRALCARSDGEGDACQDPVCR